MSSFLASFIWPTISLIFGLAVGYWVGWNRSAHPGKVESEVSAAVDKVKAEAKKL